MLCNLCPHNCRVDRQTKSGFCQAPFDFKIAHMQLHQWEEPCISGTNGSGTIFFSHCNLKCAFCQNYEISQQGYGQIIKPEQFLALCWKLKNLGAHNLNLVSPTCYADSLIKVLPAVKEKTNLPIIWNSNGYEKTETIKQLNSLIAIYLPDFKYFHNDLANNFSAAPNYFSWALKAITEMVKQTGAVKLAKNGLMQKGVLIRHLVLPGQIADSKRILQAIKDNFGSKVWVSLMSQYFPAYLAQNNPTLNRKLTLNEYNEIKDFYDKLNFSGGYFQELDSASQNYTPQFSVTTLK